eukprot:TRINITY_DN16060_c0_g1_i1.p1 TRINITY_DN16060_c0_g1~~TRINITY_DN16060_c0_g1_i1.p1  ORF type:complete len:119 (+),score=8.94 TRINITY_DN16060_c0_g1_i1:336-692(+)
MHANSKSTVKLANRKMGRWKSMGLNINVDNKRKSSRTLYNAKGSKCSALLHINEISLTPAAKKGDIIYFKKQPLTKPQLLHISVNADPLIFKNEIIKKLSCRFTAEAKRRNNTKHYPC